MTLAMTPAAVCQCFTLVSLCTSIADPNWIQVQNGSDPSSRLIYGVALALRSFQNQTDAGMLGGTNGWGMGLLYSLAALCYSAVLLSSFSFLMDFLRPAVLRSRLLTCLHICTALNCVGILAVCVACMCVMERNLQRGEHSAPGLHLAPGESFYFEILALVFSLLACASTIQQQTENIRTSEYMSIAGQESDSEPLVGGGE